MFIIDDILLAPAKGFLWLVRELHEAAERDVAQTRDNALRQLQSLHMKLEAGQIDEIEFERQEEQLLDLIERLDTINTHATDDR